MDALDMPVNVIVKAPNQKVEDKIVECRVDWTVKKLKEHLSDVYPFRPKVEQQKLVYYGKLMTDQTTLKDVFKQEMFNGYHTIHLICPQNCQNPIVDSTTASAQSANPNNQGETTAPRGSVPVNQPFLPTGDLRYRGVQTDRTQLTSSDDLRNFYRWYTETYNPSLTQQQASNQHLLVNHYCQQILQNTNPRQYQVVFNGQQTVHIVGGAAQQPLQPNDQQQPAAAGEQEDDGVVRMNAQGGGEAEVHPNDWLDTIYFFFRLLVLVLILYGSVSFYRFLLVGAGILFFYLVKRGFFTPARRERAELNNPLANNPNANNPNAINPNAINPNAVNPAENNNAVANNEENRQAADQPDQPQPDNTQPEQPVPETEDANNEVGVLQMIGESIVSFISSIFP